MKPAVEIVCWVYINALFALLVLWLYSGFMTIDCNAKREELLVTGITDGFTIHSCHVLNNDVLLPRYQKHTSVCLFHSSNQVFFLCFFVFYSGPNFNFSTATFVYSVTIQLYMLMFLSSSETTSKTTSNQDGSDLDHCNQRHFVCSRVCFCWFKIMLRWTIQNSPKQNL